jgi:uncharacterized membrane protein YfcA
VTPLSFTLLVFGASLGAGFFGSLLGLGGGIIVVPVLTFLFHVDIRYAIGASIVSVIATSSGAAAAYVRERLANLRVAMFLEVATVSGALTGAFLAGVLGGRWLTLFFGTAVIGSALGMLRGHAWSDGRPPRADAWADRLRLHGTYWDASAGSEIPYEVQGTRAGLALMYVAGAASGLLGIGAGALKVPALDLAMRLPIKASSATSNLMIGVTAAASAGVYFARGDIDPFVAAPVAAGVLLGALAGSRLLPRIQGRVIRFAFVLVLLWIGAQMVARSFR